MSIDTTPPYPPPADDRIEAAARDLPDVLSDMATATQFANEVTTGPHRMVVAADLVDALAQRKGHSRAAAAHALHRLTNLSLLSPEIALGPTTTTFPTQPLHSGDGPVPYDRLLVRSTDALWDAYRAGTIASRSQFRPNKPRPGRAEIDAAKRVIQQQIFDHHNEDGEPVPSLPHRVVNGAVFLVNCGRRTTHSAFQWAVHELAADGLLRVRRAAVPQFVSVYGDHGFGVGGDGSARRCASGTPLLREDETPLGLFVLETTQPLFDGELGANMAPAPPATPRFDVSLEEFHGQSIAAYDHGLMNYDAITVFPGQTVGVSGLSCKVIAGDRPTLCPEARPALPPSMLAAALRAVRRMNKLPPGTTIHWVGHDTGIRNRCRCHPNAPYAAPFDRERWATVAAPPERASPTPIPATKDTPHGRPESQPAGGPPQPIRPDAVVPPIVKNDRSARWHPDPAIDFCLLPEPGGYYVCGFGEEGRFQNLLGLGTLQLLIRSPGQPVPWAELDPSILANDHRSAQPAMDNAAIAAARSELNRLREEIDSADNEVEKADSQRRYDALAAQLQSELAPGGRTRDLNSLIEKIRPKIAGRLKTVYDNFRGDEPPLKKLADHFEASVSSNSSGFVYSSRDIQPAWRTEGQK